MEQTLTRGSAPSVRVAFARLLQLVGWAGLTGLLLFVAAALVATGAWSVHRRLARESLAPDPAPHGLAPVARVEAEQATRRKLPGTDDIPQLLKRIERAAVGNELPWEAGDYRLVAATEQWPPSIEVRCSLKGTYPKLRAMVTDLLGIAPAVTFKEMTFSRQAVSSADVDAKFVIVVFLADGSSMPAVVAQGAPR